VVYAGVPAREGLRRLGRGVYGMMLESIVGRVIFGAFARDISSAIRLTSRGYEVSASHSRAELLRHEDGLAIIRLNSGCLFRESYQIGIFEGAFAHFRLAVEIAVRTPMPGTTDLRVTWR
jgi:hypothetical protein